MVVNSISSSIFGVNFRVELSFWADTHDVSVLLRANNVKWMIISIKQFNSYIFQWMDLRRYIWICIVVGATGIIFFILLKGEVLNAIHSTIIQILHYNLIEKCEGHIRSLDENKNRKKNYILKSIKNCLYII